MKILKAKEAAELMRISTQTVKAMIHDGRLRGFKVANKWFVREEDIAKFIEQMLNG